MTLDKKQLEHLCAGVRAIANMMLAADGIGGKVVIQKQHELGGKPYVSFKIRGGRARGGAFSYPLDTLEKWIAGDANDKADRNESIARMIKGIRMQYGIRIATDPRQTKADKKSLASFQRGMALIGEGLARRA